MGDTLMGKEVSGTPLETRRGTTQFADFLQGILTGNAGNRVTDVTAPFQRLTTDALMTMFLDPQLGPMLDELLRTPAESTAGLFSAMEPFERRTMDEAVAGTRNLFGSMGGRFSRNVADAESQVRGEVAGNFARTREEALLAANQQRLGGVLGILDAAQRNAQMSLAPLDLMSRFFQPGAPQFQPGILPGLISAGTTLGSIALMPPIGAAKAGLSAAERATARGAVGNSIFRVR